MNRRRRQNGFSIAEILIAVGILTVAMLFIAGVFPVGIRFMQVSADRTTAAFVASEAFAKVQLYAGRVDPQLDSELRFTEARDFNDWFDDVDSSDDYVIDANTFSYPTDNSFSFDDKHYCWSAILRQTEGRDVQVTVFVSRKAGAAAKYYLPDFDSFPDPNYGEIKEVDTSPTSLPRPVRVEVERVTGRDNELQIKNPSETGLINDGDIIVDDPTGRIYRVLERYANPNDNTILLDKDFILEDWQGDSISGDRFVWVVPPPAAPGGNASNLKVSGRSPCVGIYQKVIRF